MLKNANGRWFYRYVPEDHWFLRAEFTPDEVACSACIMAKEGPLPVGARTWKVWIGGKWEDGTLTVTLQLDVTAHERRLAEEEGNGGCNPP